MKFNRRQMIRMAVGAGLVAAAGRVAGGQRNTEVQGYCHPQFERLREAY